MSQRVRTMRGAENLAEDHRVRRPKGALAHDDVRPGVRGDHQVRGEDMDGVEFDPERLRAVEAELGRLREDLVGQLRHAVALSDHLDDGAGPVAGPMRQSFLNRADDQGGVVAALLDYIDEIDEVRASMRQTLDTYTATDEQAAQAFRNLDPPAQEV
ncbi:hypothetical protein ACOBQX_15285 [Actinokineospora sp. G85]|uniref:hypothetical protein n=1 Tax=Actinokineospora sp. G85 TaxID=3406626 RepID=UPI003C781BAA